MGWMELVADLVDSLAWPGAAITIGFLFRAPVSDLIRRVRRGAWGDRTVELDPAPLSVEELEAEESRPGEQATTNLPEDGLAAAVYGLLRIDDPDDLVEEHPLATILRSWALVERSVETALKEAPPLQAGIGRRPGDHERLRAAGALSQAELVTLDWLRRTRNVVTHPSEAPSVELARQYAELSSFIANKLLMWALVRLRVAELSSETPPGS